MNKEKEQILTLIKADFVVIITTYDRPKPFAQALASVRDQTHQSWHIVAVNDSPSSNYNSIESDILSDPKVTYLKNLENRGKNFSVNRALHYLRKSNFGGYILFLDDDDTLDTHCLSSLRKEIHRNDSLIWIVSNRVLRSGVSLTKNHAKKTVLSYYRDYLLLRRFTGDATHCIDFSKTKHCNFPNLIKNGEEWIYFSQVANIQKKFKYLDIPSTYSTGYSPKGLTRRKLPKKERLHLFFILTKELRTKNIWNIPIAIYMALRLLKTASLKY